MDDSEEERRKRGKEIREYYPEKAWERAINRCKLLAYSRRSRSSYKRYLDPEHLVGDAINEFIEGKRAWDPYKYTLEQHLIYIMRSLDSNKLPPDTIVPNPDESDLAEYSPSLSPEDLLSQLEDNEAIRSNVGDLMKVFEEKDDSLSSRILDACMNAPFLDYKKNSELADYLDVSISEIENAKKRINRAMSSPNKGDEK